MHISILRKTAAEIAAAAVLELYPDVELIGGSQTKTGFIYEFYFPHEIHVELIEEKMRQIIKERRAIRTLEMVGFSAAELLRSLGQHIRASEVEEGMVELIQIGDFYDVCPGPHLKNTAELAAFKIDAKRADDQKMIISGTADISKDAHKKFLKKLSEYIGYEKAGERRGFWLDRVWLVDGLEYRKKILDILKRDWFQGACEVGCPDDLDRLECHKKFGEKIAEVFQEKNEDPDLFFTSVTRVQISFFEKAEPEMISFLQTIGKTLTMLGFNHHAVPRGAVTDYLVEDGLGSSHLLVQAKRIGKKSLVVTATVEKLIALLLEIE